MMAFSKKRKAQERDEPHFEWQFSADEAEWARCLAQQGPSTATVKQANAHRKARLLPAIGALLLLLAAPGGWLRYNAQAGLVTAKTESTDAVAAEVRAAAPAHKETELNDAMVAEVWANALDYEVFSTRLSALSAQSGIRHEDVREITESGIQ
jgi:hypothetical protein